MCRWEEGVPSAASLTAMGRRRPSSNSVWAPPSTPGAATKLGEEHHLLDSCFLCRRPLTADCDIFMYRGDTPFCSEECRGEQMEIDELKERRRRRRTLRAVEGLPDSKVERIHAMASGIVMAG